MSHETFMPRPLAPPDVSFLVGAYNVAPYIGEAVRSALAQRDVTVEVVVVDDGSTDATASVVEAIAEADPRVVLHRRPRNGGLSAARNDALSLARGRWLAVLDGDDVIAPERSRRLIELAEASGAEIVADNYLRVAEDGLSLGSTMVPAGGHPYAFEIDLAAFVDGNITFRKSGRTFGAMKQMFDARFVAAHRLRYREDKDLRNEDFLFCAEALKSGARLVVTSEPLYRYRQRRSSISHRLTSAQFEAMLRANVDLGLTAHALRAADGDPRLVAAVDKYDRALLAGAGFVSLVEQAKRGAWASAIAECLARPALWSLVVRMGIEALGRRLLRPIGQPA